jgi:hypothetical protein
MKAITYFFLSKPYLISLMVLWMLLFSMLLSLNAPAYGQSQNCASAEMSGMKINPKQTFPFDHEPFKNACFVTFSKYDNPPPQPPSGEKFFIYRDSKPVFEFPDQSQAAMTRISAVAFQDLNGDGLTDIVVATNTEVKSGLAHDGQIYVNNGKTFTTDGSANAKLSNLKSIKEIIAFVKSHKPLFFKDPQ